ncbi:MAG: CU044_2847 family protein [Coleofasciculaceae cyanobacterium]
MPSTFYDYTALTLNVFKKVAIANVDKVTLEFGIEVGVPYVTKGTAKSNLKITVECSFPEKTEPQA